MNQNVPNAAELLLLIALLASGQALGRTAIIRRVVTECASRPPGTALLKHKNRPRTRWKPENFATDYRN